MRGLRPSRGSSARGERGVASRERARIFGVLGDPVDHSLSPAMQNAAFVATRLPHLYLRFRVPARALRGALGEARQLAMGGLNLTLPLKEAVLPLLDALTPDAERGAAPAPRRGGPASVSLRGPRLRRRAHALPRARGARRSSDPRRHVAAPPAGRARRRALDATARAARRDGAGTPRRRPRRAPDAV